jgi:hypothetical protein
LELLAANATLLDYVEPRYKFKRLRTGIWI